MLGGGKVQGPREGSVLEELHLLPQEVWGIF